jgi:hypothetical protein
MWKIILTIILTSAFFILFFEPSKKMVSENKSKPIASTATGFIEDSYEAFHYPTYAHDMLESKYRFGDIGTFTGYSSVPEDHWLHGFPHEKTK